MDLFELMGKIAIDGAAQAQADIGAVGSAAADSAGKVKAMGDTTSSSTTTASSSWTNLTGAVAKYKAEGMSTSQAWAQATADLRGAASGAESGITTSFNNIGAAVAAALAVDKLVSFGASCITAASNVEEMENKFSVVFGDLTQETNQWATEYARSIGRNKTDIKTWLADNQNMFVGMGMTREQGAKLAKQMVTLGLDLASFNNLSEPDAVNALSKAMMGETESAKRLGAVLNENTLAEAQAQLGYQGKFETLTEAQKMEVRYQAILNQSADAIGDCERSMGSYKSTQTELNSAIGELKETIGSALLPVATQLLAFFRDCVQSVTAVVTWFMQHEQAATLLGIAVGVLSAAILAYTIAMNAGAIATGIATAAATAFGSVMAFVTSPITLVVLAIGALAAGLYLLYENCEPVRAAIDAVASTIASGISAELAKLEPWVNAVIWSFQQLWTTLSTVVVEAFEAVVTAIQNLWNSGSPIIETFKTLCDSVFHGIQTVVSAVFATVHSIITGTLSAIQHVIAAVTSAIKGDWSGAWSSIQKAAGDIWNMICSVISIWINTVWTVISSVMESISAFWSAIWSAISGVASGMWESISGVVSTAISLIQTTITAVMSAIQAGMTNGWNTIKTIATNLWNAITSAISTAWGNITSAVTTALGNAKTFITDGWNNIKQGTSEAWSTVHSTITSVWTNIKTAVFSTVSSVQTKVSTVFEAVQGVVERVWNSIQTAIETPINTAKETVYNAIENIKGFFDFEWSLPKLKMPHVTITGGFNIWPPSAPQFSVSWYKRAMDNPLMFTEPTIFGFDPESGQPRGAGEAGDEVMIGKETMLSMIQSAVAAENGALQSDIKRIVNLLEKFFPNALAAMQQSMVLDTGVLVAQTAPAMNAELGRIAIRKGRGR